MVRQPVGVGLDSRNQFPVGHPLSEEDQPRISSKGLTMRSSCGAALNIEDPVAGPLSSQGSHPSTSRLFSTASPDMSDSQAETMRSSGMTIRSSCGAALRTEDPVSQGSHPSTSRLSTIASLRSGPASVGNHSPEKAEPILLLLDLQDLPPRVVIGGDSPIPKEGLLYR